MLPRLLQLASLLLLALVLPGPALSARLLRPGSLLPLALHLALGPLRQAAELRGSALVKHLQQPPSLLLLKLLRLLWILPLPRLVPQGLTSPVILY